MKREAQMITVPARAIDVGYANTKFTCERKRVQGQNIIRAGLFPSITGQLQPGASFLHAPGTLGADGCITDVDGVQHFAGLGVQPALVAAGSRVHTLRTALVALRAAQRLAPEGMVIEIVDTEEKIQAFLPVLEGMMGGGLVTMEKVRVIHYRSGKATA